MEKKYPVLKCDKKLWEEIKPVLKSFGITDFFISEPVWERNSYIVSNFGAPFLDNFKIGNTTYSEDEVINNYLRYLVSTKETFLYAVYRLLNKEYMEERNIKVSLKKAREWYKSNNDTLKELALQAYSKEELCQYLEEGHRVMVSNDGKSWVLKEYKSHTEAKNMVTGVSANWDYIVPAEEFDFNAEDISVNIKKSIV